MNGYRSDREIIQYVSHELREHLHACYGTASVLAEGAYGFTSEAQQHAAEVVHQQIEHLLAIQRSLMIWLSSTELRQAILSRLQTYGTLSTLELIAETLVSWHEASEPLRQSASFPIGWPIAVFWQTTIPVKELASGHPRLSEPTSSVSREAIRQEGNTWGRELARHPFEQAIYSFALAVHEWLSKCDLTQVLESYSSADSEEDAIRECFQVLADETGVD
jgi:signal transduction histidine kinase